LASNQLNGVIPMDLGNLINLLTSISMGQRFKWQYSKNFWESHKLNQGFIGKQLSHRCDPYGFFKFHQPTRSISMGQQFDREHSTLSWELVTISPA
jgi:hypothetical protein